MTEDVKSEERFVLTNENRAEFMAAKLNLTIEPEVLAESAEAEPELEPAAEDKDAPENDTKSDKPNKLEKRFSEMTRKQKDAEDRASREADRADALERKLKALEAPQVQKADDDLVPPNRDNYSDPFKYAEDLAKFSAKNAVREHKALQEFEKAQEARLKVINAWDKQLENAKVEMPDFEELLLSTDAEISNSVRDMIIESDIGAKILYHLAENPELSEKLNSMSESKAAKEIGRLEAKLETVVAKKEPVANVSKAPQPITPVKGGSRTDVIDDENLSFKQHVELRRAGKLK